MNSNIIHRRFACALLVIACAVVRPLAAHEACFDEAGKKHHIDPLLLKAIAEVESAMNSRAVNRNSNGSEDIGLMQINSQHMHSLNGAGVTREALMDDPCLSVMVGAGILADFIDRYGYTWRAVGAYNAGNGGKRDEMRKRYALRVVQRYRRLVSDLGRTQKEKQ